MISFLVYLRKDQNQSYSVVKDSFAGVAHFYRINSDENLNWSRIRSYIGNDDNDTIREDRPYTMEELRQIFQSIQDIRMKVIIQLLTSTGMRVGAIPILTMRDIKPIDKYSLYEITVYANSRKSRYKTYCSPECRKEIENYIDYRPSFGEKITDESPLIRKKFYKSNILFKQNIHKKHLLHLLDAYFGYI